MLRFTFFCNQAKRKERMVKEKLQKQMTSVAEQQQRLNKVRMELEKLEMVRNVYAFILIFYVQLKCVFKPIRRDVDEIRSRVEVGECDLRAMAALTPLQSIESCQSHWSI
jgi:hypothetical protein